MLTELVAGDPHRSRGCHRPRCLEGGGYFGPNEPAACLGAAFLALKAAGAVYLVCLDVRLAAEQR